MEEEYYDIGESRFNDKCTICRKDIKRKDYTCSVSINHFPSSFEMITANLWLCEQCDRDFHHHIEELKIENKK